MFNTVFKNIRRSPYQSLIAVSIMLIAFFVATVYFLSTLTDHRLLGELESRPQAIAFFKDEAKIEDVDTLKKTISEKITVKEMKYLDKSMALARYRDQNKNDPLLLELVTANILPSSLEVSTINAADLENVEKIMRQSPVVDDVAFPKTETKNLVDWVKSIRTSGTILVSFLLIECLLVLFVIFALKIALRKDEIEVMRLVGASVWQIRTPFILEGMLYGLLAGLFAWGVSYIFVVIYKINPLGQIPALAEFALPFPITPASVLLWGVTEIVAGLLLGFAGSFVSVWRYLKD
ncbi:MAG: permease-like cell division protein FtsX [Patescibacteria group bacterium]